jgi:hypothetical protein
MNFKVGEKVVSLRDWDEGTNNPKKNEIVTIQAIEEEDGYLTLAEYLFEDGEEQCFNPKYFRKLDYEFAENLLAQIKQEVLSNKI